MTRGDDLAALVTAHWPGARLLAAKPLIGGVSAQVYRLDVADASGHASAHVLRVHGPAHGGHDADLEFALLRALHDLGLPVPRPVAVDTSRTLLDHAYLLLGFVDGTVEIAPGTEGTCFTAMARTLARIHGVPTVTLPKLPLRIDPVPELLDFLPADEVWRDFRVFLERIGSSPFEGAPVLLHGDFWPKNIVWRGGAIAAVIDWEDAALGDPLSDVACTCLELRYLYGRDGAVRFLDAYGTHAPGGEHRFALWQAYVAAAAQRFMAGWGLEPAREAHMRATALASLGEAASRLMAPQGEGRAGA